MRIFVQIASYRDPELVPTIKSLLLNSDNPNNLVFGICRQFHLEEKIDNFDKWRTEKRFKIIDVLFSESRGACWARNKIQELYDNEEYTLQIDSHMRFKKSWDTTLISMVKQLQEMGIPKPLLTSYVPSYDHNIDPIGRVREPWRMTFDRFIPEGAAFFLPETIPNWKELHRPVPARFYSAHFAFTLGQFCKEVQHNPEYYFHGEEISIAVRAFTWGYDLFHPHRVVAWHEYTRKGRLKQWDDDREWYLKNNHSHLSNRKLFGMDGEKQEGHEGKYGFGPHRTLRDYEEYAGILFKERAVQQYTLDKNCPPNPGIHVYGSEEEWRRSFASIFKHCIDISSSSVPETDYDFWAVAFHDEKDETLFRKDAERTEIDQMMRDVDGYCKIWREFPTTNRPRYWVVWPHSKSKGWCNRLTGNL